MNIDDNNNNDNSDVNPAGNECCNNPICNQYFKEWQYESSWVLIAIRVVIGLIVAGLLLCLDEAESKVFSTSSITVGTLLVMIFFYSGATMIIIVYGRHQYKLFPLWLVISISVIYLVFAAIMILLFLVLNEFPNIPVDSDAFDIWTIVHFLAGPFLALILPHWWMVYMTTAWEVLEYYTVGLGDGEAIINRIVDIAVAIIGWWIIILIFARHSIPWISSRNAIEEKEKYEKDRDRTQSQMTDGIYEHNQV